MLQKGLDEGWHSSGAFDQIAGDPAPICGSYPPISSSLHYLRIPYLKFGEILPYSWFPQNCIHFRAQSRSLAREEINARAPSRLSFRFSSPDEITSSFTSFTLIQIYTTFLPQQDKSEPKEFLFKGDFGLPSAFPFRMLFQDFFGW